MSKFNLDEYETVEERIRRFYDAYPDARIITENLTTDNDRAVGIWVVKATAFLSEGEQANNLPKSTGLAFEVDGQGMANKTSALENCETSAIGRALANLGMTGSRGRVTRQEMEKVARGITPQPRDWVAEADKLESVEALRDLYTKAKAAGADPKTLDKVKARGQELSNAGSGKGDN